MLPCAYVKADRFTKMTTSQVFVQLNDQFQKEKVQTNLFFERIYHVRQLVDTDYMNYQYQQITPPDNETLILTRDAFYIVYTKLCKISKSILSLANRHKSGIVHLQKSLVSARTIHTAQQKSDKTSEQIKTEEILCQEQCAILEKQRVSMLSKQKEMQFELRILEYKLKFYNALVSNLITNKTYLSLEQLKTTHTSPFFNRMISITGKEFKLMKMIGKIETGQPLESDIIGELGGKEFKERNIKPINTSAFLPSLLPPLLEAPLHSHYKHLEKY